MIQLNVQEYCNDCPYYEALSQPQAIYTDGTKVTIDTKVTCEHSNICRRLEKVLTKKEDS